MDEVVARYSAVRVAGMRLVYVVGVAILWLIYVVGVWCRCHAESSMAGVVNHGDAASY